MSEVSSLIRPRRESIFSGGYIFFVVASLILLGLYLTSLYSYLLFHSVVEAFTIVVSCSIFIIAWNSRRFIDNHYFLFIGIGFLFVSIIDLIHTLGYKGIGVFPEYGNTLSTQLWISARYIQCLSLVIAPFFIHRRFKLNLVIFVYLAAVAGVLVSIFYLRNFPTTFIDATGVTSFKVTSEYLISLIFLVSIFLLIKYRRDFDKKVLNILVLSIAFNIAAELALSSYINLYGAANIIGHFFRLSAYYLIYLAIVETGLTKPYNLLFRNLKQGEEKLRKHNVQLEETVALRTAELRAMNADLLKEIGERRNAEDYLKRSEKKYSTIVEKGNDGIIVIQDGNVIFANAKITEMTGFSREENLGRPFLDFVAPDHVMSLAERYQKRMNGEPVADRYETVLRHKNGGLIYVDVSNSIIENEGKPATMSIIRDVTEKRKLLEQAMAQDRLASVGLLVAGVAHEIKNPLTSVIGFSDLLLQNSDCKKFSEDLKIINDEAKRTVQIVDNLLTFARKQPAGKVELQMNEQINKVLALRAHEHMGSNIIVQTYLAPGLPCIMGNSSQILQVLFNLVVNAEQAMVDFNGKGTLTVRSNQEGGVVRVSIADDGPGISPENMSKLFTPFFTTKPAGKGNGLGLSICHGIVTEHGGKIWAESELGKGATFIIELPVNKTGSS